MELAREFAEAYTATELADLRKDALADLASGVQVTNVSLEGGGGSGTPIRMDPARMVRVLAQAIKIADGTDENPLPGGMMSGVNFSTRRAET